MHACSCATGSDPNAWQSGRSSPSPPKPMRRVHGRARTRTCPSHACALTSLRLRLLLRRPPPSAPSRALPTPIPGPALPDCLSPSMSCCVSFWLSFLSTRLLLSRSVSVTRVMPSSGGLDAWRASAALNDMRAPYRHAPHSAHVGMPTNKCANGCMLVHNAEPMHAACKGDWDVGRPMASTCRTQCHHATQGCSACWPSRHFAFPHAAARPPPHPGQAATGRMGQPHALPPPSPQKIQSAYPQ